MPLVFFTLLAITKSVGQVATPEAKTRSISLFPGVLLPHPIIVNKTPPNNALRKAADIM
jgi:hypothetical protein